MDRARLTRVDQLLVLRWESLRFLDLFLEFGHRLPICRFDSEELSPISYTDRTAVVAHLVLYRLEGDFDHGC